MKEACPSNREACPLCRMVLPGNFERNEHVIAVKAGNGNVVYVFKDALTDWLHKIGVDKDTLNQIRRTRPGEVFQEIEKLVKQVVAKIREVAAKIAKTAKKTVEEAFTEAIAKVRPLLEQLIKTLSLNISLSPT